MTPAEFSRAVLRSVRGAVEDGELSVTVPARVVVRPPVRGQGGGEADFACNVALQVAKEAGRPPREVAGVLRERLVGVPGIAGVEVAGAGFLNVTLTEAAWVALVRSVLAEGRGYGHATGSQGQANGQERVVLRAAAGVRAAVTVEVLERILPAAGVAVRVAARAVGEAAEDVAVESNGEEIRPRPVSVLPQPGSLPLVGHAQPGSLPLVGHAQPGPLPLVGHAQPGPLPSAGHAQPGPLPSAGHADPIHPPHPASPHPTLPHPTLPHPTDPRAHQEWRALADRLGPDEVRWALLHPAQTDAVRLPERPVQRESNGRFRVQYAYARTCAMTRNARELGFTAEPAEPAEVGEAGNMGQAGEPRGERGALRALYAALAEYPAVVEAAARYRAPDRIARHLEVTADAWLRCHDVCPPLPVGEEKPSAVHRARLALAEAAGTVLANGLHLLGISTPERL
ncbi:ArgS-related anticodon-binding protein NrtL [Streptomyces sp. NPDC017056]|uniref:ArgS-related anticodon-binding protein NrtL n=1 Tax=Streptomyces sp. NPDC017056 TaxID=3364973 RepID=UPI00379492A3